MKNPKRRYLNKILNYNPGDGIIKAKLIMEKEKYYLILQHNQNKKISINFNGKGKNRVYFKDGVLEKRVKDVRNSS